MPATTTQAETLLDKLHGLGVDCTLLGVRESPQLVSYELKPKTADILMRDFHRLGRADDIAYALGARTVRILAPIPGRSSVAVEVDRRDTVTIPLEALPHASTPLNVPVGVSVDGETVVLPITEAPHTLVAGQTGAGKSVLLHAILGQILRSFAPRECQLVLIDPKHVEFASYRNDPHLADTIASSPEDAKTQLGQLVSLIDGRYRLLEASGARDIADHNTRVDFDTQLPYIVVVADEIAELVMTTPGAEGLLVRIAQKGRAAGVHLVLATQYPKAEVITGLLRVNVPTKIALRVPDKVASRVIMGENGAELLLGKGDALMSLGGLPPVRFQCALSHPQPRSDESTQHAWYASLDDTEAHIASQRVSAGAWLWQGTVTTNGQATAYSATMPRNPEPGDVVHMLCRQLLGNWHVRAEYAPSCHAQDVGRQGAFTETGWRVSVSTNENDWETLPATLKFDKQWLSDDETGSGLLAQLAPEDVRTAAEVVAASWIDALEEPKPKEKKKWWKR